MCDGMSGSREGIQKEFLNSTCFSLLPWSTHPSHECFPRTSDVYLILCTIYMEIHSTWIARYKKKRNSSQIPAETHQREL